MGPVGQLVPFNLDAMVTFNCTVSGVQLIWQINSAQLVTLEDMDAAREIGIFPDVSSNPDGTLFGTLRINVSESNQAVNTTRIGCLAVGSSTLERDVSDFVELLTFGEHHCLFPALNYPRHLTIFREPIITFGSRDYRVIFASSAKLL